MTQLIIQKFGGTSVADLERMKRVAALVLAAKTAGKLAGSAGAGTPRYLDSFHDGREGGTTGMGREH